MMLCISIRYRGLPLMVDIPLVSFPLPISAVSLVGYLPGFDCVDRMNKHNDFQNQAISDP